MPHKLKNMETRVVKFSVKDFIEEYVFLHESKDKEGKSKLLEEFREKFWSSSFNVRQGIQVYLFNNKVAKQYPELQALATTKDVKN